MWFCLTKISHVHVPFFSFFFFGGGAAGRAVCILPVNLRLFPSHSPPRNSPK